MLRDLLPRTHDHYEGSRFAGDLEAFAEWLRAVGYSRPSAHQHVYRLDQALGHGNGIQPGGTFCEADLHAAFASQARLAAGSEHATGLHALSGRRGPAEGGRTHRLRGRVVPALPPASVRGTGTGRGDDPAAPVDRGGFSGARAATRPRAVGRFRRGCRGLRPNQEPGEQSPVAAAHCRAPAGVPALLRKLWRSARWPGRHRYATGLPRRITTTSIGLDDRSTSARVDPAGRSPRSGATTPFCISWPITAYARPRLRLFGWMRWIGRQER